MGWILQTTAASNASRPWSTTSMATNASTFFNPAARPNGSASSTPSSNFYLGCYRGNKISWIEIDGTSTKVNSPLRLANRMPPNEGMGSTRCTTRRIPRPQRISIKRLVFRPCTWIQPHTRSTIKRDQARRPVSGRALLVPAKWSGNERVAKRRTRKRAPNDHLPRRRVVLAFHPNVGPVR